MKLHFDSLSGRSVVIAVLDPSEGETPDLFLTAVAKAAFELEAGASTTDSKDAVLTMNEARKYAVFHGIAMDVVKGRMCALDALVLNVGQEGEKVRVDLLITRYDRDVERLFVLAKRILSVHRAIRPVDATLPPFAESDLEGMFAQAFAA